MIVKEKRKRTCKSRSLSHFEGFQSESAGSRTGAPTYLRIAELIPFLNPPRPFSGSDRIPIAEMFSFPSLGVSAYVLTVISDRLIGIELTRQTYSMSGYDISGLGLTM